MGAEQGDERKKRRHNEEPFEFKAFVYINDERSRHDGKRIVSRNAKRVEAAVNFAPYDNHERDAHAANDSRHYAKFGCDARCIECRKRERRREREQDARCCENVASANERFDSLGENRA